MELQCDLLSFALLVLYDFFQRLLEAFHVGGSAGQGQKGRGKHLQCNWAQLNPPNYVKSINQFLALFDPFDPLPTPMDDFLPSSVWTILALIY